MPILGETTDEAAEVLKQQKVKTPNLRVRQFQIDETSTICVGFHEMRCLED